MRDTKKEMIEKQREIILSKTSNERFMIGLSLISMGRIILESSIKNIQKDISKLDLKIAVFKRSYEKEFEKKELENIIKSIITYHIFQKKNL